jgi:hypothetical protein
MGERRHHQLLGSTTLLNPQKALTNKKQIDTAKSRQPTAGYKTLTLRQNYCAFFLYDSLIFLVVCILRSVHCSDFEADIFHVFFYRKKAQKGLGRVG